MIKNWKMFNESLKSDSYIVDDVIYDDYGYITSIKLKDGRSIEPEEDTGGEHASLEIKDDTLKPGDEISFSYEDSNIYDNSTDLTGISAIYINGKRNDASVGSEGGNTFTYLSIKNK